MDKKLIVLVGALVFAIMAAGVYVVLTGSKTGAPMAANSKSSEKRDQESEKTHTQNSGKPSGVYTAYEANKISQTEGTKLLFFHASWCPQCRSIEKSIDQGAIPAGVTVFKVDYDSNQTLRQKYGVTLQTTFVKIDDKGEKIASYVAYETPHFDSVRKALLE